MQCYLKFEMWSKTSNVCYKFVGSAQTGHIPENVKRV